jgi:regulator of sigma E protease
MTWILGIIGLGIMVFIHELGHFVAAKLNGVEVEVFSLGWGPRLIGFTRGGTSYQISWFPIGGYCKMKGELVPSVAGGGAKAGEAAGAAQPAQGSFLAAGPWRRILIAAFGPVFNLAFAILVFTIIWWVGFSVPSPDNRVILASDYTPDAAVLQLPAAAAGLKTGDRVVAIDGVPVEKFQDILEMVTVAPGKTLRMTIQPASGSGTRTLAITPQLDKNTGAGRIGIYAWVDPVVAKVEPGNAAAIAGLRPGDRILEAGDRPVINSMDLDRALADRPAKLRVRYDRGGASASATLVFKYDDKGVPNLGIQFALAHFASPRLGPVGALARSVDQTWSTVTLTVKGIGLLFQGVKLSNAVAGPLGITYAIGTAATSGFAVGVGEGFVQFFRLLAFLSVVLFLMNLLPIPAMDGGQIILFLVEAGRGRAVSARLIWRLQIVGFSLLVLVFVFSSINDVGRFIGR